MPFAGTHRIQRLEYFLLHDAKPAGPSVGLYGNRDIPASVSDDFRRHYIFAGVAPRRWNGAFDLDALHAGEFILPPGLVYRIENLPRSWAETFLKTLARRLPTSPGSRKKTLLTVARAKFRERG